MGASAALYNPHGRFRPDAGNAQKVGGTDAGAAHLQNSGVPSTTIGVCARYIHSHQTLYAMDDFLEAQAFLQAIVKKLDRSTVDLIKNY